MRKSEATAIESLPTFPEEWRRRKSNPKRRIYRQRQTRDRPKQLADKSRQLQVKLGQTLPRHMSSSGQVRLTRGRVPVTRTPHSALGYRLPAPETIQPVRIASARAIVNMSAALRAAPLMR